MIPSLEGLEDPHLTMEVYQRPGRLLLERESKEFLILMCFSFNRLLILSYPL